MHHLDYMLFVMVEEIIFLFEKVFIAKNICQDQNNFTGLRSYFKKNFPQLNEGEMKRGITSVDTILKLWQ